MLSELLHDSGIFMGTDVYKNKESFFFQELNIRLLNENGFSWDKPGVPTRGRLKVSDYGVMRRYIKAHYHPIRLMQLLGGRPWGWKDPRTTFTLAQWLAIFPKAKVIHIYRNGIDVALSLYHRNKKIGKGGRCYSEFLERKTAGLDLWEKYVAQAFSFVPSLAGQMLTLHYEKLVGCDAEQVASLEAFTGLPLREKIAAKADPTRVSRFKSGEHEDLVDYARQNAWMQKLGYC